MRSAVTSGVVAALSLFACMFSSAQPITVDTFDWESLPDFSAIPSWVPLGQSEDPAEAGFPRQWIERALAPAGYQRRVALAIVAKRRLPDDIWAQNFERKIRKFIQIKVTADRANATISRVFCNSVGCLIYLERRGAFLDYEIIYNSLLGELGHDELGSRPQDYIADIRSEPPCGPGDNSRCPWELTLVTRPTMNGPMQRRQTGDTGTPP